MRAHYLCLLLIACGDNLRPGGQGTDGPGPDTPADGPADTPPDGPPVMAMSRVWAVGDIVVDNQDMAGAFTHGTGTLPYGAGVDPPIKIVNARAFDARGGKI